MNRSINPILQFIFILTSSGVYAFQFSEANLFSNHVPYGIETEAIGADAEHSTRLIDLNSKWSYTTSDNDINPQKSGDKIEFNAFPTTRIDTSLSEFHFFTKLLQVDSGWSKGKVILHLSEGGLPYEIRINDKRVSLVRECETPFEVDVTNDIGVGENVLTLVIKKAGKNGISLMFNSAYLYTVPLVHIKSITYEGYILDGSPRVRMAFFISNFSEELILNYKIKTSLYDKNGKNLLSYVGNSIYKNPNRFQINTIDSIHASSVSRYQTFGVAVPGAEEWDDEKPTLYTTTVQLLDANNEVLEVYSMKLAFRRFSMKGNSIFVNNHLIKVKGVEYVLLKDDGLLKSLNEIEGEISIMKDAGINSIFINQNIYNDKVYSLFDQNGIYVISSMDSHQVNSDNLKVLKRHLYNLNNHPCILAWYSQDTPHLKETLDQFSSDLSIFKSNIVVVDEVKNNKSSLRYGYIRKCIASSDTLTIKRILMKSMSSPTFIFYKGDLPESFQMWGKPIERGLKSKNGLSGFFAGTFGANRQFKRPEPIFESYGFEEVNATTNTYTVINYSTIKNSGHVVFRYEVRCNSNLVEGGELMRNVFLKPWETMQVKIPVKDIYRSRNGCQLRIIAEDNNKPDRRSVLSQTDFAID